MKGFVISVTMLREAIDDIRRYRRDKVINGEKYKKLTPNGVVKITSAEIHVGDLIIIEKVGLVIINFLLFSIDFYLK